MKDLVILILIVIVGFLLWNGRVNLQYVAPAADNVPVPADVIQAIIEKVRSVKPDEYPLETLYIKPQADGSYMSRFLFYNTRKFFGIQYDVRSKVKTDGSVDITDISETAQSKSDIAYTPDTYKPYEDVQTSSSNQLKAILATRPETPVTTDMRLGTRS